MHNRYRISIVICSLAAIAVIATGQEPLRRLNSPPTKFGFFLDNNFCGWMPAPVTLGGGGLTRRTLAPTTGTPTPDSGQMGLKLGGGMSKALYNWIQDSWNGKHTRRNGAIIAADYNYKEMTRREFHNAIITDIGFPALDASSKDPVFLSVKIHPATTQDKPGDGSTLQGTVGTQKAWLPSNFRLEIRGLNVAHVTKIDPMAEKPEINPKTGAADHFAFPEFSFYVPGADFAQGYPVKWEGPELDAVHDMRGRFTMFANDGKPCIVLDFNADGAKAQKMADGSVRVTLHMATMNMQIAP